MVFMTAIAAPVVEGIGVQGIFDGLFLHRSADLCNFIERIDFRIDSCIDEFHQLVDVRGDGNYFGGNVQQGKKSGSQYFAAFLKQFASVSRFSVVQSASAAEIKETEKTMSQIENPDYLQSIAKSIQVFCMHDNFLP